MPIKDMHANCMRTYISLKLARTDYEKHMPNEWYLVSGRTAPVESCESAMYECCVVCK